MSITIIIPCSCGAESVSRMMREPFLRCGEWGKVLVTKEDERITITMPIPSTKEVQQAAGHWSRRAGERKPLRRKAHILTRAAMNGRKGFLRARLDIALFYRDDRGRDTMNTIAALKPIVDGMVDAGAVYDDCWQHMELQKPTVGIDKLNPRVVLTLTPIA